MTCESCKDTKEVFYSLCSGHSISELDSTEKCPRCKVGSWGPCRKCVGVATIFTTAKYDDVPNSFVLEEIATEDYFDDNGTHLGLVLENFLYDVSVVLKSEIPGNYQDYVFTREDHQLYKLHGKRLRITVEVLD